MATKDFKVRNGLVVGPDDLTIDVSADTATFANGYTVNIGTNRILKQTDNVSELVNDAAYIDLTDLSGGTGVTYNSSTGEIQIGQAVGTSDSVTFDTVTASSKIVADTLESAGATVTLNDNLTVAGNLTVQGTTTTLNTATLDVEDLNITVANGAVDATAADGAGLTADLGTNGVATFTYNASTDRWEMNKTLDTDVVGNVTGQVSSISNFDTGDLSEGSNLYFTTARARASISVTGSLAYDEQTGEISYTQPTNVSAFANDANYIDLTDLSTTGDAALSYNSSTGVFEFSVPGSNGDLFYNNNGTIGAATNFFFDDATNRLGINQSSPTAPIHITGESGNAGRLRIDQYNASSDAPDLQFFRSRGTPAAPASLNDNDVVSDIQSFAYNGTSFVEAGRIRFQADGTDGDSDFAVSTRVSGSLLKRFEITPAGLPRFGDSYTLPAQDGTLNQTLISDGAGSVTFQTIDYSIIANTPTNVSSFANDANYIDLTDLSAGGDLSYNSSTGEFSFTERTDQQVRNLFSGQGDITYNSATGEISFNNSTGFITDPGVSSVSGTAGEIVVSQSTGAVQFGLPTDVTIQGNLTVKGTTTTIESNTLSIGDSLLLLNGDATGSPTENAGLEVERGDALNVQFRFNETTDKWQFTNDGFDYYDLPITVTDLPNDANYIDLTDISASGDITYNNQTGEITFNNSTGFITDPGVTDVSGTPDEIEVDSSTGSVQIGLPDDIVIKGNLTVQGTTTTIESNTVTTGDNIIVLNNDVEGSPTENAGIEIERGDEFNVLLRYNESSDRWQFTNNGFTYFDLPVQVSDLLNDANYVSTLQEAAENDAVVTIPVQVENIKFENNTVKNVGANTDLSLSANTEVVKIEGGGALVLPVGNDTDRPQGEIGMIRYNSLSAEIEIFNGTSWVSIVENIDVATISDVEDLAFEAALIFG
jgi:hypothetical protein